MSTVTGTIMLDKEAQDILVRKYPEANIKGLIAEVQERIEAVPPKEHNFYYSLRTMQLDTTHEKHHITVFLINREGYAIGYPDLEARLDDHVEWIIYLIDAP